MWHSHDLTLISHIPSHPSVTCPFETQAPKGIPLGRSGQFASDKDQLTTGTIYDPWPLALFPWSPRPPPPPFVDPCSLSSLFTFRVPSCPVGSHPHSLTSHSSLWGSFPVWRLIILSCPLTSLPPAVLLLSPPDLFSALPYCRDSPRESSLLHLPSSLASLFSFFPLRIHCALGSTTSFLVPSSDSKGRLSRMAC